LQAQRCNAGSVEPRFRRLQELLEPEGQGLPIASMRRGRRQSDPLAVGILQGLRQRAVVNLQETA